MFFSPEEFICFNKKISIIISTVYFQAQFVQFLLNFCLIFALFLTRFEPGTTIP